MKHARFRWTVLLGTVILSAYILTPVFFDVKGLGIFPERGLNLGLDLRGGMYLELEVDLQDALEKRLSFMANELVRSATDEAFAPEKAEILSLEADGSYRLAVTLKNAGDRAAFQSWFNKQFAGVWTEAPSQAALLYYEPREEYFKQLKEQIISQAIEAVRNRIDRYGVAEAGISRYSDDRIVVELPGIQDPDQVLNVIRQTGQLEFKLVNDEKTAEDLQSLVVTRRKEINEEYDRKSVTALNAALKDQLPAATEIAFELSRDPVTKKITGGTPYLVHQKVELTGDFLDDARVNVYNNEPQVSLSFNTSGASRFAALTRENVGKRLAIVLDGNIAAAPQVREEIPNGQAQITLGYGNYQDLLKEAEVLALVLREGALPASLQIAKRNVIGPSLGADSIRQGVWSSIIGAVLVVVFMTLYYKVSGAVANLSLVLNMMILLAVLSLLQASLTLPGIAGIALTIGMAVDANVIIFERIKDELEMNFPLKAAFERGYSNAMSAVLDANITTFISGAVLYQFGTGPIKGFATTLMIGIVSTLVTAVLFSRWIQEMLLARTKWSRISI